MIRYTVVRHENALDQLAGIWLKATDRSAITSITNAIDKEIARDAETKGHEVEGGLRELFSPPLEILFHVSEPDRIVKVLDAAEVNT